MDLWKSDTSVDHEEAHEAFNRHIGRMGELKIDYVTAPENETFDNTEGIIRKIALWPALIVVLVIGALFIAFRFTGSGHQPLQNTTREPEKSISRIITKNGFKDQSFTTRRYKGMAQRRQQYNL